MFEARMPGQAVTLETRHDANESVERNERYREILEIFDDFDQLTAKECAVEMYERGYVPTPDRNFAGPRITELCKAGKLEPVGKTKCRYTGRTVAVFERRRAE